MQAVSVQIEELRSATDAHDHLNADTPKLQAQAAQIRVTEPQHAQQAEPVKVYAQAGPFGQKAEATQPGQHAKRDSAELIKAHHHHVSHEVRVVLVFASCLAYTHSVCMFNFTLRQKLRYAMVDTQDMERSLAMSGARMVANAVDSCIEPASSLPSADNCQVSSCDMSECIVMLTRYVSIST